MVHPPRPPANGFVATMRKVYNPIGFSHGYNFILWFIWGGAMFGFVLARLEYLSIDGIFCNASHGGGAAPGECYFYNMPVYHTGIILHLAGVLPAGFLAVFQFVPGIRHRFIVYHKTAGYLILLLVAIGIAGALMIAPVAFGGTMATQAFTGLLAIVLVITLSLAYYNIKVKQIDQHRAWMLRSWFYLGTIITLRLILILSAIIVSMAPTKNYAAEPCAKLAFAFADNDKFYAMYPACLPANIDTMTANGVVAVKADFNGSVAGAMAALNISFGMAAWLAFFLHAVGVEIYLKLTPKEAQRLRVASYQLQMKRGAKHPGSVGTVVERFGDAEEWTAPVEKETVEEERFRDS